ncbi:MAG: VOC family protein [Phycisphaeraceae bacterium]
MNESTDATVGVNQLNHVAIHVQDVARAAAFYQHTLGLTPLPRPAFDFPGAWFALGPDQELHLIGDRDRPVHSQQRGTHFALRITDAQHAAAVLRDHQVDMVGPKPRPDGATQIFITDPDGHVIELCELPE